MCRGPAAVLASEAIARAALLRCLRRRLGRGLVSLDLPDLLFDELGQDASTGRCEMRRVAGDMRRKDHSRTEGLIPCLAVLEPHDALKEVGHSPKVVKCYGLAALPDVTSGRREVKRLTGESWVPVLVLDDGEVIKDSKNIAAWAREHPASAQ